MFAAFFQIIPPSTISVQNAILIFVGGIVVVEGIKKLMRWTFEQKQATAQPNLSPAMELEIRKVMKEMMEDTIAPILKNQTEILKDMAKTMSELQRGFIELAAIERNR